MTPHRRQRGSLLIGAVALILIVGLLGTVVTFSFVGLQRAGVAYRQSSGALAVAESGLEIGIRQVKTTPGYAGESDTLFGAGRFTITLWDTDGAGAPLPPGQIRVHSEGSVDGIGGATLRRTAEAIVTLATGSGLSAGKLGEVRSWNGSAWLSIPSGTTDTWRGSHCLSATDCWLVGDNGRISHWDGTGLTGAASGTTEKLEGVACQPVAPGDCFAVGGKGVIRRFDGAAWSASPSGTTEKLRDVHCPSAVCYAVGDNGVILRWDGAAWSPETSGTGKKLRAVACTGTDDCWAVGDEQGSAYTFVKRDAGGWTPLAVPAPALKMRLEGIACIDASDCWAVGKRGKNLSQYTLVHWDGLAWTTQLWGGAAEDLKDIACLPAGGCWATGKKGRVLYYGGTWSSVSSGTSRDLNTVHFPL